MRLLKKLAEKTKHYKVFNLQNIQLYSLLKNCFNFDKKKLGEKQPRKPVYWG